MKSVMAPIAIACALVALTAIGLAVIAAGVAWRRREAAHGERLRVAAGEPSRLPRVSCRPG